MPCYKPISGYRSQTINPNGKRNIVFTKRTGYIDLPIQIPCGQCIGCRLERSRQWAIRCAHEASLYDNNCFITLTYNNENLPENKSLNLKHFQDFMKRLRKKFGAKIRFFHCGEYGEKFQRPHYHACIFNFDFPDKKLFNEVRGNRLYTSETLQSLWTFGFSTIGSVTFESAAYVARYITKKITGKLAESHYETMLPDGELIQRTPEYTTMSRRPGIAKEWFQKFSKDIYPDDFVIIRGKKLKPPKYYDTQYEIYAPEELEKIKHLRKNNGLKHKPNNTRDRLAVREFIQQEKFSRLKRSYENDDKI